MTVRVDMSLTHCSLETPKRVIGKQGRPDASEWASDQGLRSLQIPYST